jgi:hypothetical protein
MAAHTARKRAAPRFERFCGGRAGVECQAQLSGLRAHLHHSSITQRTPIGAGTGSGEENMPRNTETYQHAIGGLLQKRGEMTEEIAVTRERLAILSNDIEAIDRVLERLGYDGDVKLTPRVPRIVLFYPGELRQFCLVSFASMTNLHRGSWPRV